MAVIWRREGEAWRAVGPSGFPSEEALHDLIAASPHLLPRSGDPSLVVVGREVAVGTGYADLLAVEPDGRVAILEISPQRWRKHLVLDEAPSELVQLVGYLESITQGITVDLITVAAFEIGDEEILVPQRVDPEYEAAQVEPTQPTQRRKKTQMASVWNDNGGTTPRP